LNFEKMITEIDQEIARLNLAKAALITASGSTGAPAKAQTRHERFSAPPKRKMSASARKKIAAAQKARWAKYHAAKGTKK
jgi:hypothetical protein